MSRSLAQQTVFELGGAGSVLARQRRDHAELDALLRRLETSRHTDPGRADLLDRVVRLLDEDVRDEEDVVLPRLQVALGRPELHRLGRSWEAVRRTAPTRAHPVVSRRPPGNVLAALPLTLIDRSRDALDRLARRTPSPVAAAASGASGGLRLLSDAVERLAPLRQGEDPSTQAGRTA